MKNNYYIKQLVRFLKQKGLYNVNAKTKIILAIEGLKGDLKGVLPCNLAIAVFNKIVDNYPFELVNDYMETILERHVLDVQVFISQNSHKGDMIIYDKDVLKSHIMNYSLFAFLHKELKCANFFEIQKIFFPFLSK